MAKQELIEAYRTVIADLNQTATDNKVSKRIRLGALLIADRLEAERSSMIQQEERDAQRPKT